MFKDRQNVLDMNPILGTQKFYQVQGSINTPETGKYHLLASNLPCSCLQCRNDPSNSNSGRSCLYKEERKFMNMIVSEKKENDEESDPHGINSLKVAELKLELIAQGLKTTGNKSELQARLIEFLTRKEDAGDDTVRDDLPDEEKRRHI